jgi:hypothetical protein
MRRREFIGLLGSGVIRPFDARAERPLGALQAMGAKGREWMRRDFSWEAVAHEMLDVYRWLSSGRGVLSTVRRR